MRPRPHLLRGAVVAAGVALCSLPAHGQDVIEAGRRSGITPTSPLIRRAAVDPTMFEFRRAWRNRTEAVRARRAALERTQGPRLSVEQLRAQAAAVTGTMRVPVIAALYSGVAAPFPTADYQERLFGEGATRYTAKSFYRELSRGAFTMDGTVSPWVTLPQGRTYYEPSAATDPDFGRIDAFLLDALAAADPGMNFAQFDNDGPDGVPNSGDDDGFVDAAAFIYPAHGRSCGGPGIWPHRWTVSSATGSPFTTNDARAGGGFILVDDYLIQGGLECNGTSLMEIGTFSHEMGHALALPDLYDTSGATQGVGEWDLMGSGNYLRPNSPAHMGAWSKDFLGWVNVETLSASRPGASLPMVYTGGVVWRYSIPGSQEYFLMEHRQATLSDAFIHESGLLVWHIDPVVIEANRRFNRVNANPVHGVDLEEADGALTGRGDTGDPFPGSALKTSFGAVTFPSSNANNGQPSGLQLSDIVLAGTVTMNFTVGAVILADTGIAVTALPGETVERGTAISIAGGPNALVSITEDAPWLTITPTSGTTPFGVTLTINTTGLTQGQHRTELVLTSAGAVNSGRRVPVTVQVGAAILAVGDSLSSALGAAGERDTLNLNLTAGQVVDLGVFSRSTSTAFDPTIDVIDPAGTLLATPIRARTGPRARIIARLTAFSTGTYRLVVRDAAGPPAYETAQGYIVRTRASGPVLVAHQGYVWGFGAHGSTTPQNSIVRMENVGSGSGAFGAQSGAPWFTVTPSGGVVTAGAAAGVPVALRGTELVVGDSLLPRPRAAQRAPEGAPTADLQVSMLPAGMAMGRHTSALNLQLPADVWNGALAIPVDMRLHDARSTVINSTLDAYRPAAVAPDGYLVVGDGAVLHRVHPQTGAATPWVTRSGVFGMEFGADSALYVAEGTQNRVSRIAPDGTVTPLFTTTGTANDLAVLSDGTVFASAGAQLLRWRPGEAAATVVAQAAGRSRFALGIAYHQGSVYFAEAGRFRRLDLSTGQEHELGALPGETNGVLLNLSVGRSGRFYGMENSVMGGVLVLNGGGAVLERLWPTDVGYGTAIAEGRLYGTGFLRNAVWQLPLEDGPAPRDVLMGDASGDGQITVTDAVGVLSQVVGRALPPGWSAAAGDANCDGQTTAFDALVILSRIVGKDVSAFCVGSRR